MNCIANTIAPYRRVFKLSGETRSTKLHFSIKHLLVLFFFHEESLCENLPLCLLRRSMSISCFVCATREFFLYIQPKTADRSERRHLLLVLLLSLHHQDLPSQFIRCSHTPESGTELISDATLLTPHRSNPSNPYRDVGVTL